MEAYNFEIYFQNFEIGFIIGFTIAAQIQV
jgi:hypothetical protein